MGSMDSPAKSALAYRNVPVGAADALAGAAVGFAAAAAVVGAPAAGAVVAAGFAGAVVAAAAGALVGAVAAGAQAASRPTPTAPAAVPPMRHKSPRRLSLKPLSVLLGIPLTNNPPILFAGTTSARFRVLGSSPRRLASAEVRSRS